MDDECYQAIGDVYYFEVLSNGWCVPLSYGWRVLLSFGLISITKLWVMSALSYGWCILPLWVVSITKLWVICTLSYSTIFLEQNKLTGDSVRKQLHICPPSLHTQSRAGDHTGWLLATFCGASDGPMDVKNTHTFKTLTCTVCTRADGRHVYQDTQTPHLVFYCTFLNMHVATSTHRLW